METRDPAIGHAEIYGAKLKNQTQKKKPRRSGASLFLDPILYISARRRPCPGHLQRLLPNGERLQPFRNPCSKSAYFTTPCYVASGPFDRLFQKSG